MKLKILAFAASILALMLLLSFGADAQQGSGVVKKGSIAVDEGVVQVNNLSDIPTFGLSVVNAGTYQLEFEGSINGGTVWTAHYCTINDNSGTAEASTTDAGTWFCPNAGLTNFRVRASAYTSGAPVITVTRGYAKGSITGSGGGGGINFDGVPSGDLVVNNAGTPDGYAGASCGAGLFPTTISSAGALTCLAPGAQNLNPMLNYVPLYYYHLGGAGVGVATTVGNNALDRAELIPFRPTATITFDRLGTNTGTGAATNVKIIVYDSNGTNNFPGTLLYASAAISTASANTYIFATTSLPTFTGGHLYWVGVLGGGTVQMRLTNVADLQHLAGTATDPLQTAPYSVIRQAAAGSFTTPLTSWGYNDTQAIFGGHGPLVIGRAP